MYFLGVDIGGTKIAAGIVDNSGAVLLSASIPTPASEGGGAVLRAAIGLASRLSSESVVQIHSIGVGAGGQIDTHTGTVVSATALLPGWAGQRIGDEFHRAFRLPAFVENDVNALAIGEHRFGAAKDVKTAAFLALGTGVGGALLINGKVHHGAHWSGGELGHMIVDMATDARVDGGGQRGTLEAYASGHALCVTWEEITGEHGPRTGIQIAEEAMQDAGGPAALAVAQTGRYLGFGLVTIASMFDPDMIIIGGGMATLGEMLLVPAREVLRERALSGSWACPVLVTALGPASAVIGAAAVAMEEL